MRRTFGLAPVAALAAFLLVPAAAGATVTGSSVTSPSSPFYALANDSLPSSDPANTFHVTGTATASAPGDTVDIICSYTSSSGTSTYTTLASGVPVTGGSFQADASLGDVTRQACRLTAVDSTDASQTTAAGPDVAVSDYDPTDSIDSGTGRRYGFYYNAAGRGGEVELHNSNGGAIYYDYTQQPGTFRPSDSLFWDNPALYNGDEASPATRSQVVIDGRNAFGPEQAKSFNLGTNWPELRVVSVSLDPATGISVVKTEEPQVACPGQVALGTEDSTNCASWESLGVTLERTMIVDHDGQVTTVKDRWKSTNGATHGLDLLYDQDMHGSNLQFAYPWFNGGAYKTFAAGDTVPAPGTKVSTSYVVGDSTLPDGDPRAARGAVTVSTPPSGYRYYSRAGYEQAMRRTIPSSGAVAIDQVFSQALSSSQVSALAADAVSSVGSSLGVAFGGPATVSSSPATIGGTYKAEGGAKSLTVNGVAATINPDGTWSATVPVTEGANPLAAIVTDNNGDTASSTGSVTLATPKPAPAPAPAPAAAHLTLGKVTFKKGVFSVRTTCTAGAGTCKGTLKVTTKVKQRRKGKLRTVALTIASGKASLAPGKSKTIKAKLNRKGTSLLRHKKRLRTAVVLTQTAGGKKTATTKSLTIKVRNLKK